MRLHTETMKLILVLFLGLLTSSCAFMEKLDSNYSDNYVVQVAASIECMKNDVVEVTSYDREGNKISTTKAPAGHCGQLASARHGIDAVAPVINTLGTAAITSSVFAYQSHNQRRTAESQHETQIKLEEQRTLSEGNLYGLIGNLSNNQKTTIDSLIPLIPAPEEEEIPDVSIPPPGPDPDPELPPGFPNGVQ